MRLAFAAPALDAALALDRGAGAVAAKRGDAGRANASPAQGSTVRAGGIVGGPETRVTRRYRHLRPFGCHVLPQRDHGLPEQRTHNECPPGSAQKARGLHRKRRMSNGRILITGGAGFIASHLAQELIRNGYQVRSLDNLTPQVHGEDASRPSYLHPDVELIRGDVCDAQTVRDAMRDVDAIYHFAAAVGVGQSMYRIRDYAAVNDLGTATVLEAVIERRIGKLVVASSKSLYGEGLYVDVNGRRYDLVRRAPAALAKAQWEPRDGAGGILEPLPTPESKQPALESIYALGKYAQEQSALIIGRAYGIPTVALRFFNVYGTHQALSNPYAGVLATFAARYMNQRPPLVFEDGKQQRDFVHVSDVARACHLALETDRSTGMTFNIGSGRSYAIIDVAKQLGNVLGRSDIVPEITGKHRAGDVRHCFADVMRARDVLGYKPRIELGDGLRQMTEWLSTQVAIDHVARARDELLQHGLTS